MTAFLDTNVAVYAHDHSAGQKQDVAAALLAARADDLVVSAQVLSEFFWVVTKRLAPPLSPELASEATAALAQLPVVATDRGLVLSAIETVRVSGLSLWDAMIVQAAKRAGCDEIITEDLNHGQVIEGIEIRNPFAQSDN